MMNTSIEHKLHKPITYHFEKHSQHQRGKSGSTSMPRHSGKGAGIFAPSKRRAMSIIPIDMEKLTSPQILAKEKQIDNFMKIYEFERRTDKAIMTKKIGEFVERGMAAYEEDINIRRLKLRDLIQAEEAELTREVINQLRDKTNNKIEEMKMCNERERVSEEENRRVTAMLKRQQQYFENCPEVRDKISREMTRSVKYANLAQILEKDNRLREERRLDELWHEIMLRDIETQQRHEEAEQRKRLEKDKEAGIILMEQMANSSASSDEARRLRDDEREKLEKLWMDVRMENMNELECERTKRNKLKQDLEEQLAVIKRSLEEKAHHEATVEHNLLMTNQLELEQEKLNKAQKSANLRKEMTAYMKSLNDLRREEAIRAAEVDAIINKSAQDIAERRSLVIKQNNENRKRLLNNIMAIREIQLKEKREMKKQEQQRFDVEKELCKSQIEREAAAVAAQTCKRREMALQYGKELKTQCDLLKIKKNHDSQMTAIPETHEQNPKYMDQCKELAHKLLNGPEIITPLAFKNMLNKCETRCGTEQKVFVDIPRV